MVTIHRTTRDEIAQLAVPADRPRSPYDDLLDEVAQGQPMRVESTDSKDVRGAKMSISRLAKRRGVPITYQALTNGFAVLPAEAMSKPKAAPARRQQRRRADNGHGSPPTRKHRARSGPSNGQRRVRKAGSVV